MCQSRAANGSFAHGLFSELQRHIAGKNPSSFKLPLDIRDYFEGVKTGEQGEYAEAQTQRATYVFPLWLRAVIMTVMTFADMLNLTV